MYIYLKLKNQEKSINYIDIFLCNYSMMQKNLLSTQTYARSLYW